MRTGTTLEWPSAAQRSALHGIYFGEAVAAIGLRAVAIALVGRAGKRRGAPIFFEAAGIFRAHLCALDGTVLEMADRNTAPVFTSAVEILKSEPIARVFGFAAAPDLPSIVEEVQRSLDLFHIRRVATRQRMALLQRASRYGALTIAGALGEGWDKDDHIDRLIQHACGWAKAMQTLLHIVDPIRAWKDTLSRERLTGCEKEGLAPHPAGAINLKNTPLDQARMMVGDGWGDYCSLDAICCRTVGGDPCTLISAGSDYCCITASGATCTCRYLGPFLGPALFGTEP